MKLSIIIPVYNVEKYIRGTMESILAQKLDLFDFEVIVVNDGTPDSSMDVVSEFHDCVPNLTIIHQKNLGLSEARNSGLRHAKGELVWFVDSDDTISQDAFEVINEETRTEADIYAFDMYKVHERSGKRIVETILLKDKDSCLYGRVLPGTYLHRKIHNGVVQRFIFSRRFLLEKYLEFYPGIYFEDIEFLTRAQLYANKILLVKMSIYEYLLRGEGSIMASFQLKHLEDALKIIDIFKCFYKERALTNREKAMIGDALFQQIYRVMCWDEKRIIGYKKYMTPKISLLRMEAARYGIMSFRFFSVGKLAKIAMCVFAPKSMFKDNLER